MKARVAALPPGTNQAFELPDADAKAFGRLTLAQPPFHVLTHQIRTLTLLGTHVLRAKLECPLLAAGPDRDQMAEGFLDIPIWG